MNNSNGAWYVRSAGFSTVSACIIFTTDYSKFTPDSRADYTFHILSPDGSSDDYVYQVYSSYGII